MTTERIGDARSEVAEFEQSIQPIVFKNERTGDIVDPGDVLYYRDAQSREIKKIAAPRLSPEEEKLAADTLREALEAGVIQYPNLANHLLKNPHKLWLWGELQLMLSPEPNSVSYDFSSELFEGLVSTTAQREEYEYVTSHAPTQQTFWEEIGNKFEGGDREILIHTLSQLSAKGANQVGAMALAWLDSHGMPDEESKMQLFLNIVNWGADEQEHEAGQTGVFGAIDAPQEWFDENVFSPVINAIGGLLNGPEYAARRRDLTLGRQVAYMLGIKPPEEAGEFGWWNFTSGLVDAIGEVGGDPFAWIAGLGAGAKAIRIIPAAQKATRAGRAVTAARALLPKVLSGQPRQVYGGRFARVVWAFGNKTVDELLEQAIKRGVVDDALGLIQAGNLSKFRRVYPTWRGLSDNAIETIQNAVKSPEEFVEVLKADALNEVLRSGEELAELTSNMARSEDALRLAAGAPGSAVSPNDLNKAMNGLAQHADQQGQIKAAVNKVLAGQGDELSDSLRRQAEALLQGTSESPDLMAANRWLTKAQVDDILAKGVGGEVDFVLESATPGVASSFGTRSARLKAIFPDNTPVLVNRLSTDEFGEVFVTGRFRIAALDEAAGNVYLERVGDLPGFTARSSFTDLLRNGDLPMDLRLQAAKDRLRLDAYNAAPGASFVLTDVPQRSKRIFSWQKVLERTTGGGRLATRVRRVVARATPGRIPDSVDLFHARKGVDDLRRIGEHFGIRQNVLDDLVGEFERLDLGARQEWVWDRFMRTIGRETGVPAFEHQLIQFYKGSGIRNFSASGVDLLVDGKRIPMLSSQVAASIPIPVEEITQVFKRAQSIGNRPKLVKAMGLNGRGLGKTAGRRTQLVKRLRRELGEAADEISDEQLYDMAFSLVSPHTGLDGRGIWAGKIMPKAGSWANNLHQWFTKSMLIFRPIQWTWRVALLEEPIRAHLFNLPSLYQNPIQYMGRLREAHYIWNVHEWAKINMAWGQDVMATLLRGNKDDILKRIGDAGLLDDIFAGDIPKTAQQVSRAVENYVENALYGRVRPNKLDPIKRVPWAVKNRAHSISKAEKAMKKLQLPEGFEFQDAAQEIAGRFVAGYLGDAVGATERKLYQWQAGLTNDEAYTHGRVWGASMIQFVEDPFGRMALHRRADLLRGQAPSVTGADVVNSSRWELLAPDLRIKYIGEPDDIAIAERYLDDMLATEIDHLFRPFMRDMRPDEFGDLLDHFATSRQISTSVGNELVDWDLRSANFGAGVRQVGDFTASVRRDINIEIPSNLPAPTFDPRFMAEDDPGYASRISNWVLATFGEKATQVINRRPAWLHEYDRWFTNYSKLGVPVEHAQRLAMDHANKMVNHVFFQLSEAPYYVARLNKFLPFFGATYEVMSTWSYKMPVAVGGTWPAGIGEFARKFDRLIDGLVNMGLLDREVDEQGNSNITLNLVPPTNEMADNKELGRFLQGAGFAAVNTLDQVVSTILGLEEGLELRSQGYRLAAGHPLNPADYGILSFAQADIGLNPVTNIAVTALAARIPGAGAPRRVATESGESLADLADRLNIDVNDLVRYNREIFIDTKDFGSSDLYNAILAGNVDPTELIIPDASVFNLPESSLWDALRDTFMPFGQVSNPREFLVNFVPGGLRWILAGLALQNQPTDAFWKDGELTGIFGGILPEVNQAQAASQLNEAFMFLEAHDLVDGKGPFTRIMEKEARLADLFNKGQADEANALRDEIRLDTEAFLDRAVKSATESMFLRGMTGNMLPTSPGHVRLEEEMIRNFWDTKEYADSIRVGKGETRLRNFKNMDELEAWKAQLGAWLEDPTGDRARAVFRDHYPQLMAYLTPKTFYKSPVPDIDSYQEYQRQVQAGEREPSPLHVTMWRARSAAIQADYYNKFIIEFGNDPLEAAATALQNRGAYNELNQERDLAYQALEMWDDMHGSVYDTWRKENYGDVETWAQDQINDKLNAVRDNLNILLELEDNFDIELDLEGIANLNSTIRGAIAEVSEAIRGFNELNERVGRRNAYEEAINQYFEQIYIPYAERVSALYDRLPEVADSERQSLIYEQIKFLKNEYADTTFFLDDNTRVPFPSPLEYSWQGKSDEERRIKMQQWITRPMEWMDLDQATRIIENNPQVTGYVPQNREDFDIYRRYTLERIKLDEAFEANEITSSQRQRFRDQLKDWLYRSLNEAGRGFEVQMMEMTPYEKLELSGLLPPALGIFSEQIRYYKQVLEAADKSAGTVVGRQIVAPLYHLVEQAFHTDPNMRSTLQELGINLRDKTALDAFLPWLFFDHGSEF